MRVETYQKRIELVDTKISLLKTKREGLVQGLRSVCTHPQVERTGGEEWFEPLERNSHGYNPYRHTCKVCGLTGFSSGSEETKRIFELLRR